MKNKSTTRLAFTLAEVLIVLGIIGIVAEMTIPTLMHDFQEQVYKTAYKKAYSSASQAWLNAYTNDNLLTCTFGLGGTCNADNFIAFKNQMRVVKDCGNDTASCWDMSGELAWGGFPTSTAPAFIDASGMAWTKQRSDAGGTTLLDTNGNKPPNKYGKDRAMFGLIYSSTDTPFNQQMYRAGVPGVGIYNDMDDKNNPECVYRCPSVSPTYTCYYTSWILNAK